MIPEFIKIDLTNQERCYIYGEENNDYLGIFLKSYMIYNKRTDKWIHNEDPSSVSVSIYKYKNTQSPINGLIDLSTNNIDKESFYKSVRDQYSGECRFFEIINGDLSGFYCDFENSYEIKDMKINDKWSFVGKVINEL